MPDAIIQHKKTPIHNMSFDKITTRRGSNCVKWDESEKELTPLWVADMDFEAAPCIREALQRRLDHGIFGYNIVPDSYYLAVCNWFSRRHGWNVQPQWILYTTGVVPAISVAIKAFCKPGENVLFHNPAYNCFFSSIRNNDCTQLTNQLKPVGDSFEIDFDEFERQAADPLTTAFLLCNPHNPSGRVWTRSELERMWMICQKHGVKVIADEIHCEITMPGQHYTPFATISPEAEQNSVTLCSPTKGFNIAGLNIANLICANDEMRQQLDRAININEVCDVNSFGIVALQAAYNEGEPWLLEMQQYVWDNYLMLKDMLAEQLPQVKVCRLEGTYLVWADVTGLGLTADEASQRCIQEAEVWMNSGSMYGESDGGQHLRINIATQRARLRDALERVVKCLKP